MAEINSVTLVGRLTKDEELKYTPGGMAVGTLSLAINRRVKKNQEWVDEANYFEVVIFGKEAESLQPYLKKGKQIGVSGFLKQERWVDQQTGQKRSAVKIVKTDIQLLGGKDGGQQNAGYDNSYNPDEDPFA